jgi:hypothetical protein
LNLHIECALRYKSFPLAADLWAILAKTHPGLRFPGVEARLRRRRSPDFSIRHAAGEIHFVQVFNHQLARLEFESVIASVDDAQGWLSALLRDPAFIQARVYDRGYDYWQNATDRIEYDGAGRSIEGLPMVSNGLPYPMTADIVDTSRNPGRSVLRNGYIESVGSTMWLGSGFWQALNRAPPDWNGIPALRIDEHEEFVRIEASSQPFTTSDGEQGEMQIALRRLIFGI